MKQASYFAPVPDIVLDSPKRKPTSVRTSSTRIMEDLKRTLPKLSLADVCNDK